MFSHNVKSMITLSNATLNLFNALPKEFTKKEFEDVRDSMCDMHPLSFSTCRKYNLITIVRAEPSTYKVEEDRWINPVTNEQYDYDTLTIKWSIELAKQFDVDYVPYLNPYCLPHSSIKIDKPCIRNIYAICSEKVQEFFK